MTSVMPAASDLFTRKDLTKLRQFHSRTIRYFMITLPIYLVGIMYADPFILSWLGPGYEFATKTLQILLIVLFLGSLAIPSYEILRGVGRVGLCTYIAIGMAILNIASSWILGKQFGFFGIVYGYGLALVVSCIVNILLCNYVIGVSTTDLVHAVSFRALILAIVLSSILFISKFSNIGLIGMGLLAIIYLITYCLGVFFFALNQEDRKLVYGLLPN
jgi:O-antigen/teichoic acid export membrane protein